MGIKHLLFGGLDATPLAQNPSLYPLIASSKQGQPGDLSGYRGKVVLIVNTASKCGFTRQYDALEALYKRYEAQGLMVLGFPSNDFAAQEPGSDSEIESFCRINHGVTFPLFLKASVRGGEKQPVFKALTTQGPASLRGEVRWNFEKFLLDRDGRLVGRWRSWVSPSWRVFERAILSVLEHEAR
jgi:glutathione peroxidase